MTVLRFYARDEWDSGSWENCSTCDGSGRTIGSVPGVPFAVCQVYENCPACDRHGSLRAAALAGRIASRMTQHADEFARHWKDGNILVHCEDCQHPQSEGTWEPAKTWTLQETTDTKLRVAATYLRAGKEPGDGESWPMSQQPVHYSRCDEKCNHGGPGRVQPADRAGLPEDVACGWNIHRAEDWPDDNYSQPMTVEASWRSVDVRRLSWPHDLRRSQLAVLCLRCRAARATS